MKPCRSPYCECEVGKCTHPGFYDARGDMSDNELIGKLVRAQELLSQVYGEACNTGNDEVERLMSVADSCIIDALEALEE